MAFITEVPSKEDIEKWQLKKFLHHEFTQWTVDRSHNCFLILSRETTSEQNHDEHEDYYFYHDGKIGMVSMSLRLDHEKDHPDTLIYNWQVVGCYGLKYTLDQDSKLHNEVSPFINHEDPKMVCELLRQAFLAYKKSMGIEVSADDKITVDTSLLCHCQG